MKLEIGHYYRTRDGRKAGPLETDPTACNFYRFVGRIVGDRHMQFWSESGERAVVGTNEVDLVAEWVDEPACSFKNEQLATVNSDAIVVEAFNELVKAGRVQSRFTPSNGVTEYQTLRWDEGFRLKPAPAAPVFEPFTTSEGYRVELSSDGKTLRIGCEHGFSPDTVLNRFQRALEGVAVAFILETDLIFAPSRNGLTTSRGNLSWASVEQIVAALEAGARKRRVKKVKKS